MRYYINTKKQPIASGGNYEIHKENCPYYFNYRNGNNFIYLGEFSSEIDALNYAKRVYSDNSEEIDGCAHCCPLIHNR